jgi:hypothetical protein
MKRLEAVPAARALRVRCAAIQDLISTFPSVRSLEHKCYLWMDHHAPLLLAIERSDQPNTIDALSPKYDPCCQKAIMPEIPTNDLKNLPLIWAARSAHILKKHPLLRLLWKAAPRKTHSTDVSKIIIDIGTNSKGDEDVILSIYRASMLGNYVHCTNPPM